jgi:predicted dinucleotide-binding enzyme
MTIGIIGSRAIGAAFARRLTHSGEHPRHSVK